MAAQQPFDVFISYARDDARAVRSMLYDELLRCRTADGRRPRVFIDHDPESLAPGNPTLPTILEAIEDCHYFVPVLSSAYVASGPCCLELNAAAQQQWLGEGRLTLVPLLLGRLDPTRIPRVVRLFQYLEMEGRGWLPALCQRLQLTQEPAGRRLSFRASPTDVTAEAVLPAVEVAVDGGDDEPGRPPPLVTIGSEAGGLQGTTTRPVDRGVATFDDLRFTDPFPDGTRLTATASGHERTVSAPFAVLPARPASPPPLRAPARRVGPPGAVRFLTDERLLVMRPGGVELADTDGRVLARARLDGPVRLVHRAGELAVVAGWSGQLLVGAGDGTLQGWDLGGHDRFTVPGDVSLVGHDLEVGLWDGTVHRIGLRESRQPERVLEDPAGVQALEVVAGRRYVLGLDGWLRAYERERLVAARELEPVVRLLKAVDRWLLAVGAGTLYRLSLDLDEVLTESVPFEVTSAAGESDPPVVVCANGDGFRVDEQLAMGRPFRVQPGARLWSVDQSGDRCTLANPDGTGTLVDGTDVVAIPDGGSLAVSPDGELLAVGDADGVAILATSAIVAPERS
jgi:hypothetical protein